MYWRLNVTATYSEETAQYSSEYAAQLSHFNGSEGVLFAKAGISKAKYSDDTEFSEFSEGSDNLDAKTAIPAKVLNLTWEIPYRNYFK